jgi:hypothetical protein
MSIVRSQNLRPMALKKHGTKICKATGTYIVVLQTPIYLWAGARTPSSGMGIQEI